MKPEDRFAEILIEQRFKLGLMVVEICRNNPKLKPLTLLRLEHGRSKFFFDTFINVCRAYSLDPVETFKSCFIPAPDKPDGKGDLG